MNFGKQFKEGLITQNPVLVQLLGMCSTMAITTSFFNGLGMGVSVLIILTPVSYTHLDVYKRQVMTLAPSSCAFWQAKMATLPLPEMATRLPCRLSCFMQCSISSVR